MKITKFGAEEIIIVIKVIEIYFKKSSRDDISSQP